MVVGLMPVLFAQQITIDEAIKIALAHSPDINISKLELESAKARERFQKGDYLPRVDISVTGGKDKMQIGKYDIDGSGIVGSVSASQLLYDFGKTGGKITASKKERLAYAWALKRSVAQKILDVKVKYYNVLKAKSIIDVNKKDVALQKEQLRRAKRYYETGIKTIIDVTDAQVRLTQAKLALNNSRYDLKLQKAIFEQTLGHLPADGKYEFIYETRDWLKDDFWQTLPQMAKTLQEYILFAYLHRHEMMQARYLLESAQASVTSSQGEYYPQFMLAGNYTKFETDKTDQVLQLDHQWQAGVVLNWNIYGGNKTDAAVREARATQMKKASELAKIKLQIKREVVQSFLYVQRMDDAIVLSESVARASLQKFDQAQKRYEHGLSDYIELQDARQGYIQSLNDLVIAYYDYFIALAQLDYAIGK